MSTEVITYSTDAVIALDKMLKELEPEPKKKVMITPSSKIKAKVADKPTGKPQYMVSVDGHTAPRMVHTTIEAAKKEAERLINDESVTGNVRVLIVVGTYKPKHEWEDWL